jgi:hypothetical protein
MKGTTTTSSPDTPTPGSRGRTLFVFAVGVIVGAGLTAGLILGLGGGPSAPAAPIAPPAGASAHHGTPAPPTTPLGS